MPDWLGHSRNILPQIHVSTPHFLVLEEGYVDDVGHEVDICSEGEVMPCGLEVEIAGF